MKTISTNVFKEVEQQAYCAYLEWPLWLVLRDKELCAAIKAGSASPTSKSTQHPERVQNAK